MQKLKERKAGIYITVGQLIITLSVLLMVGIAVVKFVQSSHDTIISQTNN